MTDGPEHYKHLLAHVPDHVCCRMALNIPQQRRSPGDGCFDYSQIRM